ncbi:MAG: flagellar assembly protein FliW [Clostridiales bacterium]|nr:flagellar assembly protein FliW [Clostridiales bacterium]
MNIQTKFFGEVEINQDNVLNFKEGILGFEDNKQYILLNLFETQSFTCLQSITDDKIAFILVKPWDFFPDYAIDISDEELNEINIKNEKEIALYNIVSIPNDLKQSTANLLAPIVINIEKKDGKQYVLREDKYTVKHFIFPREED